MYERPKIKLQKRIGVKNLTFGKLHGVRRLLVLTSTTFFSSHII